MCPGLPAPLVGIMVRATDLPGCTDFVDIKFDEESPFGIDPLSSLVANFSEDSPPDTPRFGSPTLSPADGLLLDSLLTKPFARIDEWELADFDQSSPKSRSPSSVMWNSEHGSQDPLCKLVASSASVVSPCEFVQPSSFTFDLFAVEDLSSDEDAFRGDSLGGSKRKASNAESLESKKAKARQTRDAVLAAERIHITSDNPDCKRMTHNVLERKRRNDLKASYQDLRESIPELASQDRAPTAQILQKAVEFIEQLKQTEEQLLASLAVMRADGERMRAQIARAQTSS
eukprot:m.220099 g.220099  ORF g.220099 m.220099 type:complete len:287 (-) comp10311_c0_seq1:91-951(-)